MLERDAFLKALSENEDDLTTRLIYADWLEERGEDDEANRMREWTQAKKWLMDLCREANWGEDDTPVIYRDLLKRAKMSVECYDLDSLYDSYKYYPDVVKFLWEVRLDFWKNFSIVTGILVEDGWISSRSNFRCPC